MNRSRINNEKVKLFFLPYLILIVLCSLPSCKTKKIIQQANDSSILLSQKEAIDRFLSKPELSFFSGKAKVSFGTKQGTEKGLLYTRIASDSVIWAVVKKLSVEGGRAQITKDSATLINRLEKSYYTKPLAALEQSYGISADYNYIEDLFTAITPELDTTNYWETSEDSLHYIVATIIQDIHHVFYLDKRNGRVNSGSFQDKFAASGKWQYDDYRMITEGIELPFYRKYEITMGNDEYLSIEMKYSDIELNQAKDIKFSVPSHYTRIN